MARTTDFPRLLLSTFGTNEIHTEFYVNTFSNHLKTFHADISHPHKHNFYITVFFTAGTGTHEIDFTAYPIEAGSVFFLQPEQVHHWTFDSDPEGWICFHSAEFYTFHFPNFSLNHWPFFQNRQHNPFFKCNNEATSTILDVFTALYLLYIQPSKYVSQKLTAYLQLLYAHLGEQYEQTLSIKETKHLISEVHFDRFTTLLEKHFKQVHAAKFYADKLAMTTKHLHRIVMHTTGKNTTEIISQRIVLEAKRMLGTRQKSAQQVAEELGFEHAAYFSRFFKKHTGETARNFKQKIG